ncbi:hypothetical protein INT48_000205 [Thamnidium elegans]|uniref:Uncharacterized protein n=1 Tax=Thamnidium elegans TaxID=101142 RepID=A0A8H7SUM5_9FUNG|nr:hypothetical protein INT48_000205 [Thamnidium elegans]
MYNIVQNNMVVSNNMVERLNITEYNEKDPQEKYRHSFYIRRWKLSTEAIDQIKNEFLLEDTYRSVMESWLTQIGAKNDALHYYIRYVGFCVSSNPKERFESDLNDRKIGFMSNFFKRIEDLLVELKPETYIHVLKKDAITLNIQPGGFNAKYTPPLANFQEYLAKINSGFFKKVKYNSKPFQNNANHPTIKRELKNGLKTVILFQERFEQVLSRRSKRQIRKEKFKITDSYATTMYRMAKPTVYTNGNVVLAMVGYDTTVANFFNAKSILGSPFSRAGYVLCDMISRLEAWENGNYNNHTVSDASKLIGKIPFIDLIP